MQHNITSLSPPQNHAHPPHRGSLGLRLLAWLGLGFLYVPLVLLVVYALLSHNLSLAGFHAIWQSLGVSLVIASVTAVMSLLLGGMLAWAVAVWPRLLSLGLGYLMILPILIPGIVSGLAFSGQFQDFIAAHNIVAICFAHATFGSLLVYHILVAHVRRFNRNLLDASADLGGNLWQTARYIVLPQLKPGLILGGLLAFAFSFDEVSMSYFLAKDQLPLSVWMLKSLFAADETALATVALLVLGLSFIPIALVGWLGRDPA